MDKQIVDSLKVISKITKLEPFDGNNFKHWKERVLPILEFTEIDSVLREPKPNDLEKLAKWLKINKLCTHTIKCGLANKLFDNYCHFTCTKDLRDELNSCYGLEDEGAKKFAMAKYMSFKMCEEKTIFNKIEDFQN